MSAIVGITLTPNQVEEQLAAYLTTYFAEMEKAIDAAGGSLRISLDGTDEWAPEFPNVLRPTWAVTVRAFHDGREFYIDLDGPAQHGVFVTQAIIVDLWWPAGVDGTEALRVGKVKVEAMRIRAFDDQSFDLGEARAVTNGLIAAGRLMASLVEREV